LLKPFKETDVSLWYNICHKVVLRVSTLRRKRHFLRRRQYVPSPLPFDLASRLFHCAFCTRRLFRLASFFFGLADLRRQGKVICCLSHEAEAVSSRGEERGEMNTMAVANINFYFRARERISLAFKVIPILDDEKWRYFRCTADFVPWSVFHRKLFSLRCEFWERFMNI